MDRFCQMLGRRLQGAHAIQAEFRIEATGIRPERAVWVREPSEISTGDLNGEINSDQVKLGEI